VENVFIDEIKQSGMHFVAKYNKNIIT